MATKKATIKVCDVCKTTVTDNGETYYGGHPFSGWFSVNQHGGSTDLDSLRQKRQWDVCGWECLTKLAAKHKH